MRSSCKVGRKAIPRPARRAALLPAVLLLAGCLEQDAQLHQELRTLRAELEEARKSVAEAEARAATANAAPPAPAAPDEGERQKREALEAEVAELKKRLAEASSAAPEPARGWTLDSFKELASQLQTDLMQKVNDLSDQVQREVATAELEDVTVKRIKPPAELATAFSSAITFSMRDPARGVIPVSFPVQAGLDGVWRVPTVADVRQALSGVLASPTTPAPVADTGRSADVGVANDPAPVPQPEAPARGFQRQPDGSYVVNWGDASPTARAPAPAAPTPAPSPTPPPANAPAGNASAPPPDKPAIPPPVMPVQQDIIIRFN